MKRAILILALGLFLGSPAFGAELKIGYVDLQRSLNETESGKKARADLEKLIKSKQAVIDEKGKEIERLKEELDKQSALLSEEAKKAKQDELDRKMGKYQRLVQEAQREVKKKETELTNEILKGLRKVIEELGREEKYTLILEKMEGLVLYADSAIDLTDRVIKLYDEKMKARK